MCKKNATKMNFNIRILWKTNKKNRKKTIMTQIHTLETGHADLHLKNPHLIYHTSLQLWFNAVGHDAFKKYCWPT